MVLLAEPRPRTPEKSENLQKIIRKIKKAFSLFFKKFKTLR